MNPTITIPVYTELHRTAIMSWLMRAELSLFAWHLARNIIIKDFYSPEHGYAKVTQEDFERLTRKSRSSIYGALRELGEAGVMRIVLLNGVRHFFPVMPPERIHAGVQTRYITATHQGRAYRITEDCVTKFDPRELRKPFDVAESHHFIGRIKGVSAKVLHDWIAETEMSPVAREVAKHLTATYRSSAGYGRACLRGIAHATQRGMNEVYDAIVELDMYRVWTVAGLTTTPYVEMIFYPRVPFDMPRAGATVEFLNAEKTEANTLRWQETSGDAVVRWMNGDEMDALIAEQREKEAEEEAAW